MRKHLLISGLILLFFVFCLVLFKDQARELFKKIHPQETKEVPSMLKTLPFKPKIKPRHKLLEESLKPNELYLPNLVITPRGAPRGECFLFSLVISFSSKKEAQKLRRLKPLLENYILEVGEKFPYTDLISPDGRSIFKRRLKAQLVKKFGAGISEIWFTEIRFKRIKRL